MPVTSDQVDVLVTDMLAIPDPVSVPVTLDLVDVTVTSDQVDVPVKSFLQMISDLYLVLL